MDRCIRRRRVRIRLTPPPARLLPEPFGLLQHALGTVRQVKGGTNIENTVRYFGVDIDDALTITELTEL